MSQILETFWADSRGENGFWPASDLRASINQLDQGRRRPGHAAERHWRASRSRLHGLNDAAADVLVQPEILNDVRQEADRVVLGKSNSRPQPVLVVRALRRLDLTAIS